MKLHPYMAQRMDQLHELCRKYRVSRLYAFGSIVSGTFDVKTSDIDLQVVLLPIKDPVSKGLTLLELWDELEKLFEKKVDLLTDQPIRTLTSAKHWRKLKSWFMTEQAKKYLPDMLHAIACICSYVTRPQVLQSRKGESKIASNPLS